MKFTFTRLFHTEDKLDEALKNLIEESSPRSSYYFMIMMSTSMASVGLIIDSLPVLIGSMVIAPFIYSLLRISLGIVIYDVHILFKSLLVTLQSLFLALALSTLLGFIFQYYPSQLEYIGQMIGTNILFPSFCVALISGATGTYAFMKPKVDEVLPGVAIGVSLIPPLSAIGIGFSSFDWHIVLGASTMLGINMIGILLSSMCVFLVFGIAHKRNIAKRILKQDERIVEEESEN